MRRFALLAVLCLFGCAGHHVDVQPPEAFCQMLQRTENATCEEIAAADLWDTPGPSPQAIYDAWQRGKSRVLKIDPRAAGVKMGSVFFFRPKLHWFREKPYPLINLMPDGVPPVYARGVTSGEGPVLIQYSYPETIEHEAVHGILRILDAGRRRTGEAIAADPGQDPYYGPPLEFFFQVQCHGTPDDVAGDGVPGKRDQCVLPYKGDLK
jgi:hypothetical protein